MSASLQRGGAVTPLFREAWPRHGAKLAARAAGVAYDTARDWVRGRSIPSAETLLRMAERDERLAAAIRRRLDVLDTPRPAARDDVGAAPAGLPVARPGGAALTG